MLLQGNRISGHSIFTKARIAIAGIPNIAPSLLDSIGSAIGSFDQPGFGLWTRATELDAPRFPISLYARVINFAPPFSALLRSITFSI